MATWWPINSTNPRKTLRSPEPMYRFKKEIIGDQPVIPSESVNNNLFRLYFTIEVTVISFTSTGSVESSEIIYSGLVVC